MADYVLSPIVQYTNYGSDGDFDANSTWNDTITVSDGSIDDNQFTDGEGGIQMTFAPNPPQGVIYQGQVEYMGESYPIFENSSGTTFVFGVHLPEATFPTVASLGSDTSAFALCFAEGTRIATPTGESMVEDLTIGEVVLNAVGKPVPVKWIGRQTVQTRFVGPKTALVRIRVGAFGNNQPHSDLTVTADHGMVQDGLVINASALVNRDTIDWVPMADLPEQFTVYHVETEAHDVILANGAPSETFVDYAGRTAFDNHGEYLTLYGCERIVPEMPHPRISSARHVPETIRARLNNSADDELALTA
ncbi:Hint domain-containing protein [Antarctobacter heliothermus]|uniref:Hint domain-containing protein n=1 Tax=Antarctobacter heliothermus TaxID=74033 RepID=A0A239FDF5_9RHOB|nr:Hint domain-containing protein [Antarctobacter heliothermus]SNS54969.1 Hint domain-containing protein [Antarctobacter heliothermus]